VLVTGASGFVGSHLCRELLRDGADVFAVSRRRQNAGAMHWLEADVEQYAAVKDVFDHAKPQIVFHLASCVTGSRALQQVLPTLHGNLASTVNLLMCAAETGCERIVFAGSMEEPDLADPDAIPCSPYAAAKLAANAYARMFHQLYGVPAVVAKLFMIYGPAQHDLSRLIPYTITSLLKGKAAEFSSGVRPVDWIYIDDVVSGLVAAALTPGLEGRVLELGSGQLVTVREVVETIAQSMGSPASLKFGVFPDRPNERICQASIDDTQRLTGWTPQTSLAEGLRLTIDWYRAQERAETPDLGSKRGRRDAGAQAAISKANSGL
jgi:UDP-glucose 4-epimerase